MREWLYRERVDRRKTMKDMAKALGVSEGYYCLIEQGKRCPSLSVLQIRNLSKALGFPMMLAVDAELDYAKEVRE